MERHLHCTEQQEPPSNVSIYCACHEKWLSWLILVTYEMSFTLHGATGVTLQHHQILPQPRKMAVMIESCHIRNVIYIVRSSRSRPPTSPNTAPATKITLMFDTRHIYKTSVTISGATGVILQHHQILHLPLKMTLQNLKEICQNSWNIIYNARPIRAWSDHQPVSPQPAAQPRLLVTLNTRILYGKIQHFALRLSFQLFKFRQMLRLPRKVTIELLLSWLNLVTYETSFTLRGAAGVTPQHHQTHLLRKMALMIHYWSPSHIWKVIYVAGSSMQESPSMATSPNTVRPREMTFQNLMEIFWQRLKCHLQCADPRPFRAWSKHEPVSLQPAAQLRLLFALPTWILCGKIQHFALRLSFQISPNAVPATKNDTWTSPNSAPATKTECATWMQPIKYSTCHEKWQLNFTKYIAPAKTIHCAT